MSSPISDEQLDAFIAAYRVGQPNPKREAEVRKALRAMIESPEIRKAMADLVRRAFAEPSGPKLPPGQGLDAYFET